ncbi:MAG: DUF3887 domain-containing protein [Clostridiales bacterium]|nr:DUF3887 domain-containing protein [Clostridiales bacterium]
MKKILVVIMVIGLLMMGGCTNSTPNTQEVEVETSKTETEQEIKEEESEEVKAEETEIDIVETARDYIMDLVSGEYESAYTSYTHDATMKQQINTSAYQSMMESIISTNGAFVEMNEVYAFELGGLQGVAVPVKFENENVNFEVYFDSKNHIAGLQIKPYQVKTESQLPEGIVEVELEATVNGLELGGTLTLPDGGGSYPCVVLVHGSGPADRDETVLANKPFRDIAWGLAQQGIAVYRYDKGSYAYPEAFIGKYDFTIYNETINDAVEIVNMLTSVEGVDAEEIYVLGHSLGGYAIPRIAQNAQNAKGFIIMAGSARGVHEIILGQYEYLFELDGEITGEEQTVLDAVEVEVAKVNNIDDYDKTEVFMGAYKAYMQDMIAYRPIETAASIVKPVLVLQGERDYQVTMVDYNMWLDVFGGSGNWTFKLYPTLNHLMMAGEGVSSNEEYTIASSVDQEVIDDIVSFIK